MELTYNIHIQVTLSQVKNIHSHETGGWVTHIAKDVVWRESLVLHRK